MRYLCIHGHFYQPPREEPETGLIKVQPSASPFLNWNQRINFECYRANWQAEIHQRQGEQRLTIDNYAFISFNFGPTLLRWMEEEDPQTHDAIVFSDKRSMERFGYGSALAQVYHHAILPLCNRRDKVTEVRWGLADFAHRFGRKAQGIWLAETAVDVETLEVLAEEGIEFTLLAPRQAKAISALGSDEWTEVSAGTVDSSQPYVVELPSGRSIAVFFYDGKSAQSVAFGGALDNGEVFARSLLRRAKSLKENALLHFATDGESYGHHHRYGEMALGYCLKTILEQDELKLCNYAQYLKLFPPRMKTKIQPVSSWSCSHGIGRWSRNCGCAIDPKQSGEQEWRTVLRESLNWLRDQLILDFEVGTKGLLRDAWTVRDMWKSAELKGETGLLLQAFSVGELTDGKITELERLFLVQENALKMFTSCAWFFDDPAGLETRQILKYAREAIRLSELDLEAEFVEWISVMVSSDLKTPTGADIWADL